MEVGATLKHDVDTVKLQVQRTIGFLHALLKLSLVVLLHAALEDRNKVALFVVVLSEISLQEETKKHERLVYKTRDGWPTGQIDFIYQHYGFCPERWLFLKYFIICLLVFFRNNTYL